MNREFLRQLGLDDDQVNAVMAKHGTLLSIKEDEITALRDKNDKLDNRVDALRSEVKNLEESGDEKLQKKIEEQSSEIEGLKAEKAEMKHDFAINKYVASLNTKDPVYIAEKMKQLDLNDEGELVGADELADELKEKHPLLFEANEPEEPKEPEKPKPWSQGNSIVSGGGLTAKQIMDIENDDERQRLISENADLF